MTQSAPIDRDPNGAGDAWDHSSHQEFFDYYAQQSERPEMVAHFVRLRDTILGLPQFADRATPLDVVDIGGGAGTLAMIWAERGHCVSSIDINEPLIELARERADQKGLAIRFEVGSATSMPFATAGFDVCVSPELLEHVPDWEACLDEFARVLRPGGVLFLSTTNALCPRQQEFNLPFYSWYPGPLKRRYEELARTTRPEIANYAKYPALHWFTFYSLRDALKRRGFASVMDRFDIAATKSPTGLRRTALTTIRAIGPARWLSHVAMQGTSVVAVKAD